MKGSTLCTESAEEPIEIRDLDPGEYLFIAFDLTDGTWSLEVANGLVTLSTDSLDEFMGLHNDMTTTLLS
jgi:hypothetical protein